MVDWPRLVHVFTSHTDVVNAVAVSPDGSLLVSASDDLTIRFWSTATGVQIGEPLEGHTAPVGTVAFSPDGTRVVSGSDDKSVRLWCENMCGDR
jgi:WD40 repeat protein